MIERRFLTTKLELRAVGDEFALAGRAIGYNRISQDLGGFRERILPNACTRALASGSAKDLYLCREHDPARILGRVGSGNLTVNEKADGVHFYCQLPNTQEANDTRELVRKGIISECSFAFSVPEDGDSWADEDLDPSDLPDQDDDMRSRGKAVRCRVRTVRTVMPLIDLACVTNPAYGGGATNVNARNYFPEGIPVSVRSHVKDVAAILSYQRQRRIEVQRKVMGS